MGENIPSTVLEVRLDRLRRKRRNLFAAGLLCLGLYVLNAILAVQTPTFDDDTWIAYVLGGLLGAGTLAFPVAGLEQNSSIEQLREQVAWARELVSKVVRARR
jgi:hypothetical protein